jgi:hypothetical protein
LVTALSSANGGLGVVVSIRGTHGGDKLARLGEENISVLTGMNIVDAREVRNENRWELAIARSTFDVDVGAVLVHLAVADLQNELSVCCLIFCGAFGGIELQC